MNLTSTLRLFSITLSPPHFRWVARIIRTVTAEAPDLRPSVDEQSVLGSGTIVSPGPSEPENVIS